MREILGTTVIVQVGQAKACAKVEGTQVMEVIHLLEAKSLEVGGLINRRRDSSLVSGLGRVDDGDPRDNVHAGDADEEGNCLLDTGCR